MSFDTELARLARTRRAYIRFCREFNPIGAWTGETERLYAKTDDPRGPVPVTGTVDTFGTFNNFIANHEYPLEVPSITTTLIDPVNEWRALGARPSTMILNKRIGYYVRQHDDSDNILDELVAMGQTGTPRFPSGRVEHSLSIPGGDFLGEMLGRRLLTTKDWPRSLPDHQGKVIQFVYGSLTNTVNPLIIGLGTTSGGTGACASVARTSGFFTGLENPATTEGAGDYVVTAGQTLVVIFSPHGDVPEVTGVVDNLGHTWSKIGDVTMPGTWPLGANWSVWTVVATTPGLCVLTVTMDDVPGYQVQGILLALDNFEVAGIGPSVTGTHTAATSWSFPTLALAQPALTLAAAHFQANFDHLATYDSGFTTAYANFRSLIGWKLTNSEATLNVSADMNGTGEVGEHMLFSIYGTPVPGCGDGDCDLDALFTGIGDLVLDEDWESGYGSTSAYYALSCRAFDGSGVGGSWGLRGGFGPFEDEGEEPIGSDLDKTSCFVSTISPLISGRAFVVQADINPYYADLLGTDGTRLFNYYEGLISDFVLMFGVGSDHTQLRFSGHRGPSGSLPFTTTTPVGTFPIDDAFHTATMFTRMSSGVAGDDIPDGQVVVWVNGVEVINENAIVLYSLNADNRPDNVKVGFCGAMDNWKFWNIPSSWDPADCSGTPPDDGDGLTTTVGTVDCTTGDGASDQGGAGRGGYLKALLVDTGGGTAAIATGEYPAPSGVGATVLVQENAAPAISGSLTTGGIDSQPGATAYYAAATVHGEQLSELSNVIGPFTATAVDSAVQIGFSGLAAGADAIRLFRGPTSDFSQMDRYRVSGYVYSVSDLPTSTTSLLDTSIGKDTREVLDPDPHWDLIYRQTKYYSVSAIYADGVESECSGAVAVGLYPRQAPLSVQVNWSAPTGSAAVVGYRVRRQDQRYHYELADDRMWEVDASILTLTDPNTDTTASMACAQAPTVTPAGTPQPVYCLAGHWLKAVREVFVLKPSPVSTVTGMVQTLMVEGTDYTQEIREVNGNRYHCLVFAEQQRSETCQYYEVTANVDGVETNSDGTGTLLTDADDIFEHIMLNLVMNTYRTGTYFTDVPYSPGLFNRDSITTAKAVSAARVSGGYRGAGVLDYHISARQLIHDLLVSFDLNLYQYRGVWYVKRDARQSIVRGSLPTITPDEGVYKASLEPVILKERHVNQIPYFAGPISGEGANGYLVSGELRDTESANDYGVIVSEPMYLLWTQHPGTTFDVIRHYVMEFRYPPVNATFYAPIKWFAQPIASEVALTHPDGLGANGWLGHVFKILGVDLDFDRLVCRITARSIDHDVP